MSSELERLLRDARKTLPEPDAASTDRARERALVAVRRRRPRLRLAVLAGAALVVALGLGVGLGSLIAQSGSAARGPTGFGFLPEPGWFALQSAVPANSDQPAVAVAASVPFAPDDDNRGLADPSGLPYSTLLRLPPDGIVIVASALVRGEEQRYGAPYPEHELPLRVRDSVPFIQYGTQVRPEQPLGQYQLRSAINGYDVDLTFYFGTPRPSSALLAEAQGQLDRLVVSAKPSPATPAARQPDAVATASAPGIIDRAFVCVPAFVGGIQQFEASAHKGTGRRGSSWDRPAFAALSTTVAASAALAVYNELAWMTAGRPSPSSNVIDPRFPEYAFPIRAWGTLAVNGKLCRSTSARVPLGTKGLVRREVGAFDDRYDCASPRVLVRVRATLESRTSLKTYRGFLRTTVPVKEARLAVRTQNGKPLVYAEVFESGKARLFTAPGCVPD